MVIAIVVLSIFCAELAGALVYMTYKYRKIEDSETAEIARILLSGESDDNDDEEELDLSFPNTEGGF